MREEFAFLHIGKTGGSAIRDAIYKLQGEKAKSPIEIYGHRNTLAEILADRPDRRVFFVIRDPVSRFVSGFNSRFRKGKWGTNDWSPREAKIFTTFSTPNEMAESLTSEDEALRAIATKGMGGSVHFKFGLRHCLGSVEFLEQSAERLAFIGHLPTLTQDFEVLKRLIGVPADIELPPENQPMFHKTPSSQERKLSNLGEQNIRDHYKDEYPIYEWCLSQRARIIGT